MDSIKIQNFDPSTPTHKIDKVGNTKIMHVDFNSIERKFKAPTIFNSNKNQEFIDSQLFILFRDPVERIVSEFNFQYHILNGKNGDQKAALLSKLKRRPNSIEEYIEYKETQNYQTKFLLGKPLGHTKNISTNDFKKIISIELSHSFARAAVARFKNRSHVEIWEGDSGALLKNCPNDSGLCYSFWLDAHYQGISDTHKVNPILEELEVLLNLDIKIAVILIDDARCFGSTSIYPTIDEVKAVVAKYFPSASVVISEDILRVFL